MSTEDPIAKLLPPEIAASFAADLGDEETEISQFMEDFFMDYMLSRIPEDKQEGMMEKWFDIDLDDEDAQSEFLDQIEPDFLKNFQQALDTEMIDKFS